VSFTHEIPGIEPSEADLVDHFSSMTPEELELATLGNDRGVTIPLMTSYNEPYDLTEAQKKRLRNKESARKKYEHRMARRQKGSNRRQKAAQEIASRHAYASNVRNDFAHKASRRLADSHNQIFVRGPQNQEYDPDPETEEPQRQVSQERGCPQGRPQ
jgi:putative transposase